MAQIDQFYHSDIITLFPEKNKATLCYGDTETLEVLAACAESNMYVSDFFNMICPAERLVGGVI